MSSFGAILSAVLVGLIALALGKRKKKIQTISAPDNPAADVATQQINDSLKEDLTVIDKALDGDSAASDLADLGNARKR